MLTTGLVLKERPHIGDVTPPAALEDMSRFGNDGVHTSVVQKQLPSGLWVTTHDGSSSFIESPNTPSLNITSGVTVSVWLNFTTLTANGYLIVHRIGTDGYYMIESGGLVTFKLRVSNSSFTAQSDSAPVSGVWRQYVGVWSIASSTVTLYENAAAQSTTGSTAGPVSVSAITGIGGGSGFTIGPAGDLALTRIYNRELSAQEISDLFEEERHWFGV